MHENRQPDIEIFVFNASKTTRTLAKNLIGYAVQDVSFENDTVSRYHVNDVESCLFLYDAVYTNGQNYRDFVDLDIERINHVTTGTLTPEDLTTYAKRPYFECPRDISFLKSDDKTFIQMFDWKNFSLDDKYFQNLCKILLHFKDCYGTSKFDVGKAKFNSTCHLKKTLNLENREHPKFQYN